MNIKMSFLATIYSFLVFINHFIVFVYQYLINHSLKESKFLYEPFLLIFINGNGKSFIFKEN